MTQSRPTLVQFRPNPETIDPSSTKVGPNSSKLGQLWPGPDQNWPCASGVFGFRSGGLSTRCRSWGLCPMFVMTAPMEKPRMAERIGLPERCDKVARHPSQKVIVEQFSISCPKSGYSGQGSQNFGRCWPTLVRLGRRHQCWSIRGRFWPIWAELGQHSAEIGELFADVLPDFGRTLPDSAKN